MSVCLFKPGKRVILYAKDHRHYAGVITAVSRRGALVRVTTDAAGWIGRYAGTHGIYVNARVFAP